MHHHLKGNQRWLCPLNLSCGSGKASARLQALWSEQPTSRDTINPVVLFQDFFSPYSMTDQLRQQNKIVTLAYKHFYLFIYFTLHYGIGLAIH